MIENLIAIILFLLIVVVPVFSLFVIWVVITLIKITRNQKAILKQLTLLSSTDKRTMSDKEKGAVVSSLREQVPSVEIKASPTSTREKVKEKYNTLRESKQPDYKPPEFESKAVTVIRKIWNWIIVGEEFRNRNLSVEYAVAVTWLVRMGIFITVIGAVFFINYSIRQGWLGPLVRLSGILLSGVIMVAAGIKFTGKKYNALAQGVLGGGIALLYIGIFAGYAKFKIISVYPAFILMILITALCGIIAVKYKSLLPAILGVIGGYMTPVLINTGFGNISVLYTYILLLGIAVLFIAKYCDWKLLNFMAFAATYLLFLSSLEQYNPKMFPVVITFLSAFFLLFSFISVLYNVMHKEKTTAIDLIFIIFNVSIFFLCAYNLIVEKYHTDTAAILTLSLAIFYIIAIYLFLYFGLTDQALLVIQYALASFFITFTVPILFSGDLITVAWAIQAFIFIRISMKLKSAFVEKLAYILYFLVLIRVVFFEFSKFLWISFASGYWNGMFHRFMTFAIIVLSFAFSSYLLRNKTFAVEAEKDMQRSIPFSSKIFSVLAIGILFLYSTFELDTLLLYKLADFRGGGISILWALYAIAFILAGIKKDIKPLRYTGLILFLVVGCKVFLADLDNLSQLYRIIAFIILGLIILAGAFIYIKFKNTFAVNPNAHDNNNKSG